MIKAVLFIKATMFGFNFLPIYFILFYHDDFILYNFTFNRSNFFRFNLANFEKLPSLF